MRSLIQGALMPWYGAQLTLLCATDVIAIGLCAYFRNYFLNKLVFVLVIGYHAVLLSVDICFLIDSKYPLLFGTINYDLMIFSLICALLVLLVALTIFVVLDGIYAFFWK